MSRETLRTPPVDGFRLAVDVHGAASKERTVVLLHGWPGDRTDYRSVVPLLEGRARLVVPDLRGFGDSDRHAVAPVEGYSAQAQVRSVLGLLDHLGVPSAWFVGYDIGSRLVQHLLSTAPGRVLGAVLTPPLPGAAERMLAPAVQREFWYQTLHRLPLSDDLLDGHPDAVRAYLGHIWQHWSGEGFDLPGADLDRLVDRYGRPGAFSASVGWYRSRVGSAAGAGAETGPAPEDRVQVPVEVVWPGQDPLFPAEWSDRLGEWYSDVALTHVPASGHFVPLEAPDAVADAVLRLWERAGS
ncbi:Pimeloyl-ACP methyl ester carboxylesterase [Klenkia soli]|uniref:Pimeloyl-ACP methyl ester carboxylesterase n=1 Tax=Klenkia soli TaxID=1052260 RepID=A0A1H0FY11_9ACTN|nr:alpha/beta hydrolase [Klenkia soli]SDN99547.1 Pimeloyl-ACP methyl ester carboxylesterase [Klenkia soli]